MVYGIGIKYKGIFTRTYLHKHIYMDIFTRTYLRAHIYMDLFTRTKLEGLPWPKISIVQELPQNTA